MQHTDPEILALLALGEQVGSSEDHGHLRSCGECQAERDNLARAAAVGRSTVDAGELIDPPERVWSRISAEVELSEKFVLTTGRTTPMERSWGAAASIPPRASLIARHRHSSSLRRPPRRVAAFAIAASLLILAGGGVATWFSVRSPETTVLASATLDAFPGWDGASGKAVIEEKADGARVVQVSLDAPRDKNAYREVWLITSDSKRLVSLGVVRGSSGSFTVPDGIDFSRYDLVDISAEPYDGDPAHSGTSILRGQLS
ncbi:MAG: anti-sigma factor [Rhodoglobus sp.]